MNKVPQNTSASVLSESNYRRVPPLAYHRTDDSYKIGTGTH